MEVRTRTGELVRDDENDEKSGFSDAFKRAAAKFGVARYLYRDGVPAFVREREPAVEKLPPEPPSTPEPATAEQARGPAPRTNHSAPRTGKALFAWTKDQEQRHEVGLLKYLNNWAKLQEFPGRMVDWDAEQVGLAYSEALRKLQAIGTGASEAYEEALSN